MQGALPTTWAASGFAEPSIHWLPASHPRPSDEAPCHSELLKGRLLEAAGTAVASLSLVRPSPTSVRRRSPVTRRPTGRSQPFFPAPLARFPPGASSVRLSRPPTFVLAAARRSWRLGFAADPRHASPRGCRQALAGESQSEFSEKALDMDFVVWQWCTQSALSQFRAPSTQLHFEGGQTRVGIGTAFRRSRRSRWRKCYVISSLGLEVA
jgi:hypothetical protein